VRDLTVAMLQKLPPRPSTWTTLGLKIDDAQRFEPQRLQMFEELRELLIESVYFRRSTVRQLDAPFLARVPRLEHLKIVVEQIAPDALIRSEHLRDLELGVEAVPETLSFPRLTKLRLHTRAALPSSLRLPGSLRSLALEGFHIVPPSVLRSLHSLEELELDAGFTADTMAGLTSLRSLRLRLPSDPSLEAHWGHRMPTDAFAPLGRLTRLDLGGTRRVTSAHLAPLVQLEELEYFVGDPFELPSLARLRSLELSLSSPSELSAILRACPAIEVLKVLVDHSVLGAEIDAVVEAEWTDFVRTAEMSMLREITLGGSRHYPVFILRRTGPSGSFGVFRGSISRPTALEILVRTIAGSNFSS
jgi:hypothetical protein